MKIAISLFNILNFATILILTSCSPSGPSDAEILEIAKKDFIGTSSSLLIEIKIIEKKSSRNLSERSDQVVFPVTVSCNYVRQGFKTGWIAGGGSDYFEPYYEDTEYKSVREFLIGIDNFQRWIIVDSRTIQTETTEHRRPASKTMELFYSDRKQ